MVMKMAGQSQGQRSRQMEMEVYKAALSGSIQDIQKYLDDTRSDVSLLPLTPTGNSVLHLHVAAPFHRRPACLDFIRYLLEGDDNNNLLVLHRNDDGETALHLAASFGQLYAVQQLLVQQVQRPLCDLLLITDKEGDTALHLAVRNGHLKVVQHLMSLTADTNDQCEYAANAAGETPLSLVAENRCMELVFDMVLNQTSRPHQTDLLAAVMHGTPGTVNKILQRFPELLNVEDEKGHTPLHYAAGFNSNILKVLLFEYDSSAIAYTQDYKGRTAAHIAVQRNNVHGLTLLMDRFPGIYELVDHQHRNVVHYAAFLGWPGALKLLCQEDIRFFYLLNKRDQDGNTPLHLLATTSLTDLPAVFRRPIYKLIPKLCGSRQRVYNNEGLTAADIACSYKTDDLDPEQQRLINCFLRVVPRGGQIKPLLPDLEDQKSYIKTKIKDKQSHSIDNLRDVAKYHAVIAALIATVSFTAGLAVPGGFNQTTGNKDEGTAILTKKAAFQAFLVSDTVALTSSFIAILLYYLIALEQLRMFVPCLLFYAFIANSISMVALMVAFMAGTYSILWPSTLLCVLVTLIASAFLYFAARLFTLFVCQHFNYVWTAGRDMKSIIQRFEP